MRTITIDEFEFAARALASYGVDPHSIGLFKESLVEPMADGGMGSLRFYGSNVSQSNRRMSEAIVQGEFNDRDGMLVSFTINLDNNGNLFELDLWRVDFEPLQRLPSQSDEIRIIPTHLNDVR